jgi:hypothetical protein
VSQLANSAFAGRKRLPPRGGGAVEAPLLAGHDDLTGGEKTGRFESVQHRVDGAGTQTMPVSGKLIDQRRAVNVSFAGVVHDVDLHGAAIEVLNEIHVLSIADIAYR